MIKIHHCLYPAILVLISGLSTTAEAGAGLVPPSGYTQAVRLKHGSSGDCDSAPEPYIATLDFPSKYEGSGSSRDQFNAESSSEYKQKTAAISAMEKGFASLVKKYMASGNPAQLSCAMSWLGSWADAKALEGEAPNHTGRSVRKWTLAALASSYLRLKFSSTAPLHDDAGRSKKIEAWFGDLGDRVMREWSPDDPISKINNHYYWVGWSLVAAGVATDRRDLFDRGIVFYRIFEKQIDADGYLPNELSRASRALGYHDYALAPLTMIAAFGKANGIDLASEGDHALSRLAHRVVAGLADPSLFEKKVGTAQDASATDANSAWDWLEPYCWTVSCEPALASRVAEGRPHQSTRLGGDLTAIYAGRDSP